MDSLQKNNKLINQAHELETQVKKLQSTRAIGEQLVNQIPQGNNYNKNLDRKRKSDQIDPENQHPDLIADVKQKGGKSDKKRGRPTSRNKSGVTKNSKAVAKPHENNLSIRKLLENTRTDLTVKSADIGQSGKVKFNGHIDAGRTDTDLSKTRPSLPISIPLDCLPETNVRQAMEHAVKTNQEMGLHSKHINVDNAHNNAASTKASIDQSSLSSSDKPSSWTAANFVANQSIVPSEKSNLSLEKVMIHKKYGHILNGNTTCSDILKQSIVERLENKKLGNNEQNKDGVKRKHEQEMDSVSKRLLLSKGDLNTAALLGQTAVGLNQTGSPESRSSTAMLISTANQPLAISAIPSPDLHNKQLFHLNEGNFEHNHG